MQGHKAAEEKNLAPAGDKEAQRNTCREWGVNILLGS